MSGELKASLFAAPGRTIVEPLSDHSRITFAAQAHWHGNAKVSQGLNSVAGAVLLQGEVQISWQAQHFRKVKCPQGLNCVAGSTFARSGADFVAGAGLS